MPASFENGLNKSSLRTDCLVTDSYSTFGKAGVCAVIVLTTDYLNIIFRMIILIIQKAKPKMKIREKKAGSLTKLCFKIKFIKRKIFFHGVTEELVSVLPRPPARWQTNKMLHSTQFVNLARIEKKKNNPEWMRSKRIFMVVFYLI